MIVTYHYPHTVFIVSAQLLQHTRVYLPSFLHQSLLRVITTIHQNAATTFMGHLIAYLLYIPKMPRPVKQAPSSKELTVLQRQPLKLQQLWFYVVLQLLKVRVIWDLLT